jgi:hypothetical protein
MMEHADWTDLVYFPSPGGMESTDRSEEGAVGESGYRGVIRHWGNRSYTDQNYRVSTGVSMAEG